MKIELIEETRISGKEWYCVYVDGVYADSFMSIQEAQYLYELVKKNGKIKKPDVILKSEEL